MKKRISDLLIIFFIGLLPILWLPGQTLLLGHDAGIPLDPVTHFLDRFSVWSQRLNIGSDQSFGLLGAILIHGLEAFLISIGFSIKEQQIIQFCFWFMIPGFSMYFLSYKIWPEKKYLPLLASVVYMINFYLMQAWFVAERTKFSIYTATPIIAYFMLFYLRKKIGYWKCVIGTGLFFSIFNGGGSIPLYGGLFVFWALISAYWLFIHFNLKEIFRLLLYFSGVGLIFTTLNAFWIFSYVYYLFGFYSRDLALAGGARGALDWAIYLSSNSTFINLLRGQGIPDWNLNQYHAYAGTYMNNPLFILISFIFPISAFVSLLLLKNHKDKFYIYFFTLLTLISLIFAAGPSSQLGIIYKQLTLHVPGFAIFRSAYYKFDYIFWLGFGILIGYTLDFLLTKIEKVRGSFISIINGKIIAKLIAVALIVGYLFYHYPFLNGVFLDYSKEPGKELTTRITVPSYVFEFGDWMNRQDFSKRYLITPELSETGYIAYQWKYWSLAPINSLQTKNSFVYNTFLVPMSQRILMNKMYSSLLSRDMSSFLDFIDVFAIDGIVLQEDFDWENKAWGTTNPLKYREILDNDPNFKKVKTFGKWIVYDIVPREKSLRVTATPRISFLHGELSNITSFPYFDPRNPLYMNIPSKPKDSTYFISEATDIYLSPDCITCNLEPINIDFKYYNPKLLPGSPLYLLVKIQESNIRKNSNTFSSMLNFLLTVSDRRIIESKWIIDSKTKLEHLEEALSAYFNSLVELESFVDRNDWGVSSGVQNLAAQSISAHMEEEANLIEATYSNNLNNIISKRFLASSYDKVLKIHQIADDRQWVTKDTRNKRYLFDLQRLGDYGVYVKKTSLADQTLLSNSSVLNSMKISLPGEKVILVPVGEQSGWMDFGSVNIRNKILRIELTDSTVRNLLEGIKPVLPEDNRGIKIDSGIYTLTTDSQNKCFYFPLKNLDTIDKQYIVSFSYRNLTSKVNLAFLKAKPGTNFPKLSVNSEFLNNNPSWTKNTDVQPREKYILSTKNPDINLYFCNGFVTLKASTFKKEDPTLFPGQDVIQIKDITVNEISVPSIVLYLKKAVVKEDDFVKEFKKTSTYEYKIKIIPTNKPITLVMRENYGKFWQLCEKGKKCMNFNDINHFESAGFTNGWYLNNGASNDITLFYYPQKTYQVGIGVTLLSLGLIAGGICYYFIKRK